MGKYLIRTFVAIMLCLALSGCTQEYGRIENVEIIIGASDKFNKEEIEEAIKRIKEKFADEFRGCELLQLWYDEESSSRQIESYMEFGRGSINGVNRENVIILFSNFETDSSVTGGPFEPNMIYEDWMWILIRDSENHPWRIDDWGY